jgi:hypothetical protein
MECPPERSSDDRPMFQRYDEVGWHRHIQRQRNIAWRDMLALIFVKGEELCAD